MKLVGRKPKTEQSLHKVEVRDQLYVDFTDSVWAPVMQDCSAIRKRRATVLRIASMFAIACLVYNKNISYCVYSWRGVTMPQ